MQNNIEFISIHDDKFQLNFSTAERDTNFNCTTADGISNIQKLKGAFDLEEICYLKQIHSDKIFKADNIVHEGDALITNKKNYAVGVFTADCVPVLMYDKNKEIIAAVHSGWQGTLKEITYKTIIKMVEEYGANAADINVYIGPHNRCCCYEFGEDAAYKFSEEGFYDFSKIYVDGKLNLSVCINEQAKKAGIMEVNIHDLELCTYCSKKYKFFSYRKHECRSRMFSFIYIK